MTWFEKFGKDQEPTDAQITDFIDNPMWAELNEYLQTAYKTTPKKSYSGCSGQPGWNVKYQKGGKSLCTLYPMEGFFIALVVIGTNELTEFELRMPTLTSYVQDLYTASAGLMGAKWLMIAVTGEDILSDVKQLISLRRAPK